MGNGDASAGLAGRVPVAVVTGFLGAGKSTFLEKQFRRNATRRVAWVVNEFSRLDVDGQWLRGRGLDVRAVPGGSLFCACLATTFKRVMEELGDLAAGKGLDGVVIEASGMSKLDPLDGMLEEFGLAGVYGISSVTCLVDPATLPVILQTLNCAASQVRAADHVVVNKTDIAPPGAVDAAVSAARSLAPGATLHLAAYGGTDLDVLEPVRGTCRPPGLWAEKPDAAFSGVHAHCTGPLDAEKVAGEIASIGGTLHRAKGIIAVPGGGGEKIDWSGGELRREIFGGVPESPGVVLFPKRGCEGPAQSLARRIVRGELG